MLSKCLTQFTKKGYLQQLEVVCLEAGEVLVGVGTRRQCWAMRADAGEVQ